VFSVAEKEKIVIKALFSHRGHRGHREEKKRILKKKIF